MDVVLNCIALLSVLGREGNYEQTKLLLDDMNMDARVI
jgi:pentatricopeptide repeat protein